jgi:hypothetical protein
VRQEAQRRQEAVRQEAARLEALLEAAQRQQALQQEADLKAQRQQALRQAAHPAEPQRLEAQRLEAQRLEAERLEAQRLEPQRLEAQRLEAQRHLDSKLVFLDMFCGKQSAMDPFFETFRPPTAVSYSVHYLGIDIDPARTPALTVNLQYTDRLLSEFPNAGFIVHGSPDFLQYSAEKTHGDKDVHSKVVRNYYDSDLAVLRYLNIVEHIERSGRLIQAYMETPSDRPGDEFALCLRPFMRGYQQEYAPEAAADRGMWIRHDVSYCRYHAKVRNNTKVWTRYDQGWTPKVCLGNERCWAVMMCSQPGEARHGTLPGRRGDSTVVPSLLWSKLLRGVVPLVNAYISQRGAPQDDARVGGPAGEAVGDAV